MPNDWSGESKSRTEMAKYVRARIEEILGKPIPPSSRIDRMTRTIIDAADCGRIIKPDDSDFSSAVQAVMDLGQISFSLERLGRGPVGVETKAKIKRLLLDSVVPSSESDQSPGRNYQFELFVNAISDLSGLNPNFDAESGDIKVRHGRFEYCFECKRVKSIGKLEANVRQARKQIVASGLPGVIWMDITIATNPNLDFIAVPAGDDLLSKAGKWQLHKLMDKYYESIKRWISGSDTVGMMLINHVLHSNPHDGDWSLCTYYYTVPLLDQSHALFGRAKKLLAAIECGVKFVKSGA